MVRSIDMALGEFELLLDSGEMIERTPIEIGVKALILIVEWTRSLHVAVVIDDIRRERIVTSVHVMHRR